MIKKLIPSPLKLRLHLLRRTLRDLRDGHYFAYAQKKDSQKDLPIALSLKQELKPNEAKKKNLLLAIQSIESIQINPNEIFSFWKAVGQPIKRNGFIESRSLVNGQIEDSVGGGLCQLSGLIYYLSLQAQLEILERHNHSLDIYTDETRFTPLGSDATVAFGHKDLKLRNTLGSPIRFKFTIEANHLSIHLMHDRPIEAHEVEFKYAAKDETLIVATTLVDGEMVDHSSYKRLLPN